MRFRVMILSVVCVLSCAVSYAQEVRGTMSVDELLLRMDHFVGEMDKLGRNLQWQSKEELDITRKSADVLSMSWDASIQPQIDLYSSNGQVMQYSSDFNDVRENILGMIAARENMLNSLDDFAKAEKAMALALPKYEKLFKNARALSLSKQSAAKLEKLKAREQLQFPELQAAYAKSLESAKANPGLKKRMDALENVFLSIKIKSDKIQNMVYKPLIERIKDYLMSLAALSIFALFVSFVAMRMKAARNAKEAAKKMNEMIGNKNKEYPTI
ncbi:MAG: hypothetical protein MJY76_01445 [Bacteroidales bacterium]|nr:hypothetical protein [Bacteroidales bacterium]